MSQTDRVAPARVKAPPRMVVLDPGHGPGNPSRPLGAQYGGLIERDLAVRYVEHIRERLAELGIATRITDGSKPYAERQADVLIADCYVSCHVNAGRGDYGAALHEWDRDGAASLADAILDRLAPHSDLRFCARGVWDTGEAEGHEFSRRTVGSTRIRALAWGDRGRGCVAAIAPEIPSVLVEPGFIDSERHAALWTDRGLQWVGHAIADGIADWLAR